MITFDFEYYKPDTIDDAINTFKTIKESGRKSIFYGGGSEIINLSRADKISYHAAIDLKAIPQCNVLESRDDSIVIGAAVPMTKICEYDGFPLLTEVLKRIAEHTSRNRISLGGNVCSGLHYNEGILPLLLSDANVLIAGTKGLRTVHLIEQFDENMVLLEDEFIVQFIIDSKFTKYPYKFIKKTKNNQMEYPVVSIASLKCMGSSRFAFSGVCSFPFRSDEIEKCLNRKDLSVDDKIKQTISMLPGDIVEDIQSSSEFRKFAFSNALRDILDYMEGVA